MKAVLLLFLLSLAPLGAEERSFPAQFHVADHLNHRTTSKGVKITYLGTNGYLLESKGAKLIVDPYFTRASLWRIALGLRIDTSDEAREFAKKHLPKKVDAILVTHGHFDHLLDVPWIAKRTQGRIVASVTSTHLATAAGAVKVRSIGPGGSVRIAGARVRALAASHDCIFGRVPFPGTLTQTPHPPRHPSHWVCGEPLAFLIEMGGKRIYIDSGGTPDVIPSANLGRIDLAILGVALEGGRQRLPEALSRLKPRYFLPSHQDNFFSPLRRGFRFGPLTDFGEVKRLSQGQRMILLDYFQPWTLQ